MAEWPLGDDPSGWPTVSVVMPIRNEAENLRTAVEAVLAQDYPLPFEVCLALAASDDGTDQLARELTREFEQVVVVDNVAGTTPAGLNTGIRATEGEVVVRVDGHAKLSDGYIRRAVETMSTTGAVNVGGVQDAVGQTPFEEAVAAAMTSWLGTGGSKFHVGGSPGPVDTVYLGVFRRTSIEAVGLFDEQLIRNQDYELNIRLRAAGGLIWFDPELSVEYRPRGSLQALARQYFEYGWWKAEVARIHPSSLRPRQIAPIGVVIVLPTAALLSLRWKSWVSLPLSYAVLLAASSCLRDRRGRPRIALSVAAMHLTWGAGFLSSALSGRRKRPPRVAGGYHPGT